VRCTRIACASGRNWATGAGRGRRWATWAPSEERAEARETALEMAREVDEATKGLWGLEEWVSSAPP